MQLGYQEKIGFKSHDVVRDRLYAVQKTDSAAVISIVNIKTNSVIAQGGEFSFTLIELRFLII